MINTGLNCPTDYISNPADDYEDRPQWTPIGDIVYVQLPGQFTYDHIDTLRFKGTFDGAGHSIYNAYYNTVPDFSGLEDDPEDPFSGMGNLDFSGWNKGFFGYIEGASIKNLHLVDAIVMLSRDF